jgi:protein-disulfide isomerase
MHLNELKTTWRFSSLSGALALFCIFACGPASADPGSAVLGSINGEPITQDQVEASASVALRTVDLEYARKRHETLEMALGQYMAQRLLELAAKEEGTTAEQILTGLSSADVSDADVDAFYEANKSRIQGTKDQMQGRIREYLAQQQMQAAYSAYVGGLQERYKATTLMQPFRAQVDPVGPSLGPAEAPVTVVEFSDFQCPYCVRVYPVLQDLVKTYGNKVRLVYRQFPLNIHDQARVASEASLCADEQNRFWDMHNTFFNNQSTVNKAGSRRVAEGLGLDMKAYDECMASGRSAARVDKDLADGEVLGVTGTPATFINGRMVSGAASAEQFKSLIDDELARLAK